MEHSRSATAPWHLWAISGLALLWYASGAITIQLAQLGRLPLITADEVAYYAAKPAWLVGLTALTSYGSTLGAVLLLLRRKACVPVFALALAGILIADAVELIDGTARAYANSGAAVATAAIAVIAAFMVGYARIQQQRGRLR